MAKSKRGFKYHFFAALNTFFAHVTLITEKIALPRRAIRKIIWHLGDTKGKTVLEYGCSVGTLTMHLVQAVGVHGKVYATELIEPEASITKVRLKRRYHKNAIVIHDLSHDHRIHPEIKKVDAIVSVGMMPYIKVDTILKDMNKRLSIGDKLCFLEYERLFGFIANAKWLRSDSKIKYLFRSVGFTVTVKREKGFFWEYVYIYGKKFKNIR